MGFKIKFRGSFPTRSIISQYFPKNHQKSQLIVKIEFQCHTSRLHFLFSAPLITDKVRIRPHHAPHQRLSNILCLMSNWYHTAQQKMAIIALPPPSSSDGKDNEVEHEKVTISNLNGAGISNSATIFFPSQFDSSATYSAVIIGHPSGGVKEQVASLYARKLTRTHGLLTVVFDSSYNGGSTGAPRHLENPSVRVEDVSAVVDYLKTKEYVNHIGVLGICTAGGYAVNAAINDPRISSLATVNCVNIGAMFRQGWEGDRKDVAEFLLNEGAEARTEEANHGATLIMDWSPETRITNDTKEQQDAYEYYRTLRGAHPDAPSKFTGRSLTQLVSYDAFHLTEVLLKQPTLCLVGSEASTKWNSRSLKDKVDRVEIVEIEGATHFDLYDKDEFVDQAVDKLGVFFTKSKSTK